MHRHKTILNFQYTKQTIFGVLLSCLFFTSCHTYYLSVDTLKDELSLQDDTLKYPRMLDVKSKNSDGKSQTISLKPHSVIRLELKSEQPQQNNPANMLKGVRRRLYVPPPPPVYRRNMYLHVDDAYIKEDTLYAYENRSSRHLLKLPVDSILRAVIDADKIIRKHPVKKGVWFSPSYASKIDGLSLSLMTTNEFLADIDTMRFNGMNLGIEVQWTLIAVVAAEAVMIAPFYAVSSLFGKKDTVQIVKKDTVRIEEAVQNQEYPSANSPTIIIQGVNIGLLGSPLESNTIKGLNICGTGTYSDNLQGVSISGLVTISKNFDGLCVAGLVNHTKRGKGLQIGLTNFATDFQGFQIGLWNRIGKFGFPFVNLRLKKKK